MNRPFFWLLIAQFLSAFADNTVLFTVIARIMHANEPIAPWYVPALQSVFLISFVFVAPWSGYVADHFAKSRVLLAANVIKTVGTLGLFWQIEPLFAYSIVGLGAAMYSPAKYGILPELVEKTVLVKANSWMEASTILAILTGMMVGASVADKSIALALGMSVCSFVCSAGMTLFLPRTRTVQKNKALPLRDFYIKLRQFWLLPWANFVMISSALFWVNAAAVRVLLIVWAPPRFSLHDTADIAQLTLFLAIGIVIGSALASFLQRFFHLTRLPFVMVGMALLVIGLSGATTLALAQGLLLLIGVCGGLFIVPINALLQHLGEASIGAGHAVALQGFFQNSAMLVTLGVQSYVLTQAMSATQVMQGLGGTVLGGALCLCLYAKRHARASLRLDKRV